MGMTWKVQSRKANVFVIYYEYQVLCKGKKKHDFGICIFSEIPEMSCLSCVFIFLSWHSSAWLQCLTGWNYFYPWRKFHQSLKALQEFQCNTWYNLFQEYQQAILTEIWPKKVAFWLKTISRLLQRNRNNKCCWLWQSAFSSPFFLSSSMCCLHVEATYASSRILLASNNLPILMHVYNEDIFTSQVDYCRRHNNSVSQPVFNR